MKPRQVLIVSEFGADAERPKLAERRLMQSACSACRTLNYSILRRCRRQALHDCFDGLIDRNLCGVDDEVH